MSFPTRSAAAAIAVSLAVFALPVGAKDPPRAMSPLVNALAQCRAIADSSARLICFDGASARLIGAATSGEVTVVDRSEMREARRSLFGYSMPKLPLFGGDTSAEGDTGTLDTTVTESRAYGVGGHYMFKVAEGGATWETLETYMNWDPPHKGSKVTIKRGPMGSYFVRIDGQRGVKGHRVN